MGLFYFNICKSTYNRSVIYSNIYIVTYRLCRVLKLNTVHAFDSLSYILHIQVELWDEVQFIIVWSLRLKCFLLI
jgi:hypothetical protein